MQPYIIVNLPWCKSAIYEWKKRIAKYSQKAILMNDGLYKICNICLTMSYVKSSSMDNETFVLISSSQCLYNVYGNLLASAVIRKKENKSIRMEYILENVFLLKILLDQDGFKDTQTSICNGHAMVHPHMLWMINHSFVTLFTQ